MFQRTRLYGLHQGRKGTKRGASSAFVHTLAQVVSIYRMFTILYIKIQNYITNM